MLLTNIEDQGEVLANGCARVYLMHYQWNVELHHYFTSWTELDIFRLIFLQFFTSVLSGYRDFVVSRTSFSMLCYSDEASVF